MDYLGLCLCCKDENIYLDEWLNYHLSLGVDHVFILDNNSEIPVATTVGDWIRTGKVTVRINRDAAPGRQCRAYAQMLHEHGSNFHWIGFIDTDEFLVPKTGESLPAFLTKYESFGGLGVFWHCFGSNGHLTRQPSVIRAYTRRAPDYWEQNNHIKSIVQPRRTIAVPMANPHHFKYAKGYCCVDEDGVKIEAARRWPRTSERIQLNHYITRSREEWQWKFRRGGGNRVGPPRPTAFYHDNDACCNEVEDTCILAAWEQFAAEIR